MSEFARSIYLSKYSHSINTNMKEEWPDTARRVAHSVMDGYAPEATHKVVGYIQDRMFMPGGRYLYSSGRPYPQVNNCFLFRAEDSREGWADLMHKVTSALMTGGGVGCVYSGLRHEGAYIRGMGGTSTGPLSLMQMVNEAGRHIMQGGSRRAAIWAGLHWAHPDVFKYVGMKNWAEVYKREKAKNFLFPAPMDGTNISVGLDRDFFAAMADPNWRKVYRHWAGEHVVTHEWACKVYWLVVRQMCETAEPGFSVDMMDPDLHGHLSDLRNACTEVDSHDDSDCCNLGSINMARFSTIEQFADAIPDLVLFLLCGTLYSKMPTDRMAVVREKNRRIGLGLMGVHEWLLARGYRYGDMSELGKWMTVYETLTRKAADDFADKFGIARPVACRSIAPTGTISIVAETTSGIEPIYAVAYKRRYLRDGNKSVYQYVIDATAARIINDKKTDPALIEDAYELAEDVERRIKFQSDMQSYVDQGIASTINIPKWGSSVNNEGTIKSFGDKLLKYLPTLRGITAYPDECRGGQPLNRVSWKEAVQRIGEEIEETYEPSDMAKPDDCKAGICAS